MCSRQEVSYAAGWLEADHCKARTGNWQACSRRLQKAPHLQLTAAQQGCSGVSAASERGQVQRQPPLAVRLQTSAVRQQLRYDTGVPARCCKVQSAPACFGQTRCRR